jgi:uncharacterized protein (DUF924 family)
METERSIREFWFGTQADDKTAAAEKSRLWWGKDPAIDRAIAERFASCVEQAAAGQLDTWRKTPEGLLALILLTDQFRRNIYRDTPAAFSADPLALGWSREAVSAGIHRRLRPIERVFLYLPFEHSESLADQDQAVALFQELVEEAGPNAAGVYDGYLDFAHRHREVIQRFGRFPHRNRILGRASTAEEEAFLKQKGSSF